MPALEAGFLFCVRPQLRQPGDVGRYPPRLIATEQVGGRVPAGLRLIVDVAQRLPVVIPDDEAASIVLFDVPWWREAALLY